MSTGEPLGIIRTDNSVEALKHSIAMFTLNVYLLTWNNLLYVVAPPGRCQWL